MLSFSIFDLLFRRPWQVGTGCLFGNGLLLDRLRMHEGPIYFHVGFQPLTTIMGHATMKRFINSLIGVYPMSKPTDVPATRIVAMDAAKSDFGPAIVLPCDTSPPDFMSVSDYGSAFSVIVMVNGRRESVDLSIKSAALLREFLSNSLDMPK